MSFPPILFAGFPRPHSIPPDIRLIMFRFLAASLILLCSACQTLPTPPPGAREPPLAREIVLYNWSDYMPQAVLDAFKEEYGTSVIIHTFESQEEAIDRIITGAVSYDLAVIEHDLLPTLISHNLLAEVNYENIPNFVNISANFRDLAVDPDNRHSVPYNWGTSGLIVRSDLAEAPITKWADLWDPRYAGKIGIRNEPVEIISIALRSLGYPLNSEDPAQLEAALKHLLQLKKSVVFLPADLQSSIDALNSGRIVILQGWNGDALVAREQNPAIQYVLPEEGTMLWGDNFVISAASRNQYTAELFVNFILRPEISAQIVETYFYPSANDSASRLLSPDILNDPLVYPPVDYLTTNHFYTPLSDKGSKLYKDIWKRFLEGD